MIDLYATAQWELVAIGLLDRDALLAVEFDPQDADIPEVRTVLAMLRDGPVDMAMIGHVAGEDVAAIVAEQVEECCAAPKGVEKWAVMMRRKAEAQRFASSFRAKLGRR